jgi:hypothetical protein
MDSVHPSSRGFTLLAPPQVSLDDSLQPNNFEHDFERAPADIDHNENNKPYIKYNQILDGIFPLFPNRSFYLYLTRDLGTPCDADGFDLTPGSPPPPQTAATNDNYAPFLDRPDFELADFLFMREQMPGKKIDDLMEILAAKYGADAVPYADHNVMYDVIDSVELGDAPWQSFSARYTGELPEGEAPPWMLADYDVWCQNLRTVLRNQLANPDFNGEIDYTPKQEFGVKGERRFHDFMSGNWAWHQAVSTQFYSFMLSLYEKKHRTKLGKTTRPTDPCLCL